MRTLASRVRLVVVGGAVLVLGGMVAAGWMLAGRGNDQPLATRQAEVAAKGRSVMPFDLDRTTHRFQGLPDGGRQTVTADEPTDRAQVTLIRAHLRKEQAAFARGDFTDPASIHGPAMPGLAQLEAGASRIGVRYRDLPDGAELRYTTSDPVLVVALHDWFKAQTVDHGRHAEQQP
jgi:hypothetical protein